MLHNIKYEVISDDELTKEAYSYCPFARTVVNDQTITLTLDHYERFVRETKRHKWQTAGRWDRLERRGTFLREQVPQREEVRQAVLKEFVERITIE